MNTIIKILFLFTTILLLNSCSQDDHLEHTDEIQLRLEESSQEIETQRVSTLPHYGEITVNQSSCGNNDVSVPFTILTRDECQNLYVYWTHAQLYPYYATGNWDIKIYLKWTDSSFQIYNEVFDLNEHFDSYANDYPYGPSIIGRWFFSTLPARLKFRVKMTNTLTGCSITSAEEQYTLLPCP